jgi:hypothetical protein
MNKGRGGRASVFEDAEAQEIDLSAFAPKPAASVPLPSQEQVRAVSEASNFPSRQATSVAKTVTKEKRPQRRYRTGRNVQFNAKASQDTIDRFYAICDQNPGWVMGYTLERAVDALERELRKEKVSKGSAARDTARHEEKLDA